MIIRGLNAVNKRLLWLFYNQDHAQGPNAHLVRSGTRRNQPVQNHLLVFAGPQPHPTCDLLISHGQVYTGKSFLAAVLDEYGHGVLLPRRDATWSKLYAKKLRLHKRNVTVLGGKLRDTVQNQWSRGAR